MTAPTYSTDVDAVGTLITTEWGNPPQQQPAGVPNFQGYGATGQGIEEVYPYLYNPTVDVPPQDEAEGGLALQEQEWVEEVVYLEDVDPEFIEGGEIGTEVVFENPLDTVSENDGTIASDNDFTVFTDGDANPDNPDESNIPSDIGETPAQDEVVDDDVTEKADADAEADASEDADAEEASDAGEADAEASSDAPQEGTEPTEADEAPVVAPEANPALARLNENKDQ